MIARRSAEKKNLIALVQILADQAPKKALIAMIRCSDGMSNHQVRIHGCLEGLDDKRLAAEKVDRCL